MLPRVSDRSLAVAAAIACLITAGYLAIDARQEARLRDANELGLDGRFGEAIQKAKQVTRRPALTRALVVQGTAGLALSRAAEASRAFARAVRYDPNNWLLRRYYGIALLRLRERGRARTQMARALALNPRMALPRGFARAARRSARGNAP